MNVVLAFVVAAMIRAQIRIAAAVIVGFVTLDVQGKCLKIPAPCLVMP